MRGLEFSISHKSDDTLARAGTITTPHGQIQTPAFIVGGTKATVKALTPEQVSQLGGQAILVNTYHLMLQPGAETVRQAGGLQSFMNWQQPSFSDSGGFQVFSLGMAYKKGIDAISHSSKGDAGQAIHSQSQLARINDQGVSFRSHLDGRQLNMTPESSMELQHQIGADIHMCFDELTSPLAGRDYIKQAMDRTHAWADRCLERHQQLNQVHVENDEPEQALYGVVQGAREEDYRRASAAYLGHRPFDGYGIGGVFEPGEIKTVVSWVNQSLPPDKPRHLLGMGAQPADLFLGVEYGIDTFDCVAPTRQARNGALYTLDGRINVKNANYAKHYQPIDQDCDCYTCQHFSAAYLNHLFKADEILASTLASIHNERFVVRTVDQIRQSIIDGHFRRLKMQFLNRYYGDAARQFLI